MALETLYLDDSHPALPEAQGAYKRYTLEDQYGEHQVVLPHATREANDALIEQWSRFAEDSVIEVFRYIHGRAPDCSVDAWEHVLTHPPIGVTGPEPFGVLCVNRTNDHKATIHQLSADTDRLPRSLVSRMRDADRIILLANSNIEAITAVHGVRTDDK